MALRDYFPPSLLSLGVFNNNNFKTQARRIAQGLVNKTPKERDEEAIRISRLQMTQAVVAFTAIMRALEKEQTNFSSVSVKFLQDNGISTETLYKIHINPEKSEEQFSLTNILQKVLNELQETLNNMIKLLAVVQEPMSNLRKFQLRLNAFMQNAEEGYKQGAHHVVEALNKILSTSTPRVFNQADLTYILGANTTHPALNFTADPPSYALDAQWNAMHNALHEQFPYTEEIAAQYNAEQYHQILYRLGQILTAKNMQPTDVQPKGTASSKALQTQMKMILRPGSHAAVCMALEKLQVYQATITQQQLELDKQQQQLLQAVMLIQDQLAEVKVNREYLNSLITQVTTLLDAKGMSNHPQFQALAQQFNQAMATFNNLNVDPAIAIILGGKPHPAFRRELEDAKAGGAKFTPK